MKKSLLFGVAVVLLGAHLGVAQEKAFNFKPPAGVVPDAQTAKAIAVAVWFPIYGKDKIKRERPFKVTLRNGVWFVRGSLLRNRRGGVAEVEIAREDGRVLRISHGR